MKHARTATQIAASKANGALSAGPVTDEGKARSSENAIKHGIFSKKMIIDGESQEEFDNLADSINRRWSPATEDEQEAVRELILLRWRIRRAAVAETQLLTAIPADGDPADCAVRMFKHMDNVSKYQARLRRLELTAEQRLREIQEVRMKAEKDRQDEETKHEREVARHRTYAKRFLMHRCILKDPLEKTQTVEEILGVNEVPTDTDVLEALLDQVYKQYCREAEERFEAA